MATVETCIKMLREKYVLGEYGPMTRPYVVLDIEEYEELLHVLRQKKQRAVPRETTRKS